MDRVSWAVRADRLPVAYQFSAARMIEERNASGVAEWLADAPVATRRSSAIRSAVG